MLINDSILYPMLPLLNNSNKNQDLVRQLVGLSHALNLQVVAEGVEIKSQLEFLQENNCDLI